MTDLKTKVTQRRFREVTLLDGTPVRLRSLLRSEQRLWREKTSGDKLRERYSDDVFLAWCICDDDGNPIFSPDEALAGCFDQWDMSDTQALLAEALDLCHMRTKPRSVEGALKNSSAASGNGSSGS